jgi:hypothetical protein
LKSEGKIIWIENDAKKTIFAQFSFLIIFAPTWIIEYIIYNFEKIDFYMVLNSCEKLSD